MANRLLKKIQEAARRERKLFCAFLTLGYPNISSTEKLIEGFAERGVDLIELGFHHARRQFEIVLLIELIEELTLRLRAR